MNGKDVIIWDNQRLEPVLITYNRSADLQRTLAAFVDAGLTFIKMHILDNASTDETAAVVSSAQAQWSNLSYHRNTYNIGGNANILRAVEMSASEYSWIIGDDDAWQLEDISELCSVLHEGKADVIRLGWLVSSSSRGKMLEAVELVEKEKMFFASLSMISATIIRRDIIKRNLPHAYMGISDAYPQLVPILRSIGQRPLQIYTVNQDLMTHTPSTTPGYYFGDLEWYCSWFRMSRFVEARKLRRIFVGEVASYMSRNRPGSLNEFMVLVKAALNYKALGVNQWPYLLSMLAYGAGWRGRVVGLMVIYGILPMRVATWLRKIYFFATGRPDKGLRFDRTRL
jgi:glycosyltransferase involved in cell wall biosynthesis